MDEPNGESNPPSITTTNTTDQSIQRKHQAMLERLSNRHQSRLQSKNPNSNSTPAFESTDSFLSQFSHLKQSITSKLAEIENSPQSFTRSDLDNVSNLISDTENLVAQNSYHLPSYEVRSSLKTISDLKDLMDNVALKLVPRKKFSFKNKSLKQNHPVSVSGFKSDSEKPQLVSFKDKSLEQNDPVEKSQLVSQGTSFVVDMETLGFKGREGEILVESFKGKDMGEFTLCDLSSCDVRLVGKSRTIFVHRLRNCKVYVGPVMGSVLIDDVEGCFFVLASHQIRIHNAKGCDFYLRVRSRPIIEDSNEVRFAPYCLEYDGIEEDLRDSRLDEENGNWANVDDFKWLRAVQSPNWSILPEDERINTFHVSC